MVQFLVTILLLVHGWQEERALVPSSPYKGTNPIMGPTPMTSSTPNHLPKAPLPNTITLGFGTSTYEFGGNVNIQSIAAS